MDKGISRLSLITTLFLGYEFFFGLNLEFSIDTSSSLFNIFGSDSDLGSINSIQNNKNIINAFEASFQPIISFTIGYNFAKLFDLT